MSRSSLFAPVLLCLALLDPTGLAGQAVPRTGVFEIEPPAPSGPAGVTYDHNALGALVVPGGFAVYWSTSFSPRSAENASDSIHGRLIDVNGRLGARLEPDSDRIQELGSVSAAREKTGEMLFAWSAAPPSRDKEDVWIQRFTRSGEPEAECQKVNGWGSSALRTVAASGGGISVVAWIERSRDSRISLKAGIVGGGGEPAVSEILVDDSPGVDEIAAGVDGGGRFVIVWVIRESAEPYCDLVGQRFAPDGTRLGERFTIWRQWSIKPCPYQRVSLAMTPGGSFAVAWKDWTGPSVVLRCKPDGSSMGLGAHFYVPSNSLASDRHGNLAWMLPGIQLFNQYMVSQGIVWPDSLSYPPTFLALGDRLLAVWSGPRAQGGRPSVLGQIWDLRRDADAAVHRGNRFLFDTAGDGGEPDVDISFGSSQDVPLLGDYNGDGLDDPCLYRDGRFLCDTAHDGGLAEKQSPAFGKPGDVPLLGDFDGDGRDDPCVRRGKTFLCDADRNGKADRSVTFGQPGDQVVIGDVDGDGRGDPCVVRGGSFLCDSAHNGGRAETHLSLSAVLSGLPPGTPALGDVNGDGREDPCVFVDGRLLCGIFAKGARLPSSIVDRTFGAPGDVFLLGDLDAF